MSDRDSLQNSWKIRSYLYFMGNGIKHIFKSKAGLIITGIIFSIYALSFWQCESHTPDYKKPVEVFSLSVICFGVYFAFILCIGKPKGARHYMRDFQRIGLTNKAYETPLLFERRIEDNAVVLLFRNVGIPIYKWSDLQEDIESGLNLNIFSISEQGKKWIVVKAVSGDAILPSFCEWNDRLLSDVNFELILGRSYMGEVIVNLSVTPHMLIGGSTGSGKTILLKNLLFQTLKKGADIYIADFKGGVDFPKVWHESSTIITDQNDLIKTLNDIVMELYRRRDLLVRSECANIDDYNSKYSQNLPRIIFACDEVAELLDKTGLGKEQKQRIAEIEGLIATIARLGRAFGIHILLATQRPDVNIISGQIKNNIDYRVCGRADDILSQIILDKTDANDLIPKDAQGRFLTNSDILFQGYWFDDRKL